MKQIEMSTSATPWLASLCGMPIAVSGTAVRSTIAPITMPAFGLTVDGAAKLRQEKTARVRLGAAAFAYGTTGMVTDHAAAFGRPVSDPQTTSTANGGVQGPPPWRQPVIT
ncbi:hypothetical protein [Sphaerisporangium perillae]|uniref:hypothetical protein n=1 Tax=Sphaerisporangium perillae TaxID=2935860 RepID=UPI0020101F24|nr:hypothetical protein [Sphaerisporangium perillae]